jgi:hypothetical protein
MHWKGTIDFTMWGFQSSIHIPWTNEMGGNNVGLLLLCSMSMLGWDGKNWLSRVLDRAPVRGKKYPHSNPSFRKYKKEVYALESNSRFHHLRFSIKYAHSWTNEMGSNNVGLLLCSMSTLRWVEKLERSKFPVFLGTISGTPRSPAREKKYLLHIRVGSGQIRIPPTSKKSSPYPTVSSQLPDRYPLSVL